MARAQYRRKREPNIRFQPKETAIFVLKASHLQHAFLSGGFFEMESEKLTFEGPGLSHYLRGTIKCGS